MGSLSRRDFLKGSARGLSTLAACSSLAVISSACTPGKLSGKMFVYSMELGTDFNPRSETTPVEPVINDIFSKLVMVTDSRAVSSEGKIDQSVVRTMLDRSIRELTGHENLEEAWLKVLPGLKSDDIISIKINCLNYIFPTHPEVVEAVCDSLIEAGIKPNNIIVWDNAEKKNLVKMGMVRSGYRINTGPEGVRFLATDSDGIGYDVTNRVRVECLSEELFLPVSNILSQISDHVINVPVLKHQHFGITGCMKNFYGAIPLGGAMPGGVKGAMNGAEVMATIRKMHADLGNPQIPSLYSNPTIRDKVRLNILDAMVGSYSGGPYGLPQWINRQVIISDDPVAVDYHHMLIVEKKRKEKELPSILRLAKYIQTAAERDLGTNNPEQIEFAELLLG